MHRTPRDLAAIKLGGRERWRVERAKREEYLDRGESRDGGMGCGAPVHPPKAQRGTINSRPQGIIDHQVQAVYYTKGSKKSLAPGRPGPCM